MNFYESFLKFFFKLHNNTIYNSVFFSFLVFLWKDFRARCNIILNWKPNWQNRYQVISIGKFFFLLLCKLWLKNCMSSIESKMIKLFKNSFVQWIKDLFLTWSIKHFQVSSRCTWKLKKKLYSNYKFCFIFKSLHFHSKLFLTLR